MKCPECSHQNPSDTRFCGMCGTALKKPRKKPPSLTKTLSVPCQELDTGALFAGRYQVIEDLGKGGMGHVYKVLDREINEAVALKTLRPGLLADDKAVERFHNELRLARRISHKNVCGVYHLGKDEQGTYYITMEYVPGEDLKSLVRRIGPLTVGKAVLIAEQICDGLAEAHRLGVVHRDLKPQNIMIDREGHVRVMDFGIARSLEMKGPTDSGAIIGTPDYMAPEQIEGKETDRRTDIYALGLILYEMLTGRMPFEAESALAKALVQRSQNPPSPKKFNAHVPDSLCRVVLTCLERKKERRFAAVEALRVELGRIEAALHLTASAPSKKGKTRALATHIGQGFRWRWAGPAVLGIAGLALIGWALLMKPESFDPYISLELTAAGPAQAWQNAVEFVLNRVLSESTKAYVFVQQDLLTYKKKTESQDSVRRRPELSIVGDISPKVVGFDINLTTRFRDRTMHKTFDCKGQLDFVAKRADDILAYLADLSHGFVAPPDPAKPASQVCTANIDSLEHFLNGEDAWARLDSEQAFYEYRTALENDPSFALPHLRLVDVLIFRIDLGAARRHLDQALAQKNGLTDLDLIRLYALRARLDAKPNEERQFLRRLTEEFPFRKEYHYEFAESYFHYGEAEEAIRHYGKALELDPNYARAHNHIAYCYSWVGQHDKALTHLMRYQELDPSANSYDSLAAGYVSAGDYERSRAVVRDGLKVDPNLDFLYTNELQNLILLGKLAQGGETIRRQADITTREITKNSVGFWLAFVAYLKGDLGQARRFLAASVDTFRQEAYRDRLDESPNQPSWLAGVLAARSGDLKGLQKEIDWMENKIGRHSVSATNFSPIWKFYVHLKILAGGLQKDRAQVLQFVEEGRRVRTKMGYWGSLFNLPYFYNLYAEALMGLDGNGAAEAAIEAQTLLEEAEKYNPHYAWTHLNLARLDLRRGRRENGRTECALTRTILAGSDPDYVLAKDLEAIQARLGN